MSGITDNLLRVIELIWSGAASGGSREGPQNQIDTQPACSVHGPFSLALEKRENSCRARSDSRNQQTYPQFQRNPPGSCPSRRGFAECVVRIAFSVTSILALHREKVWRNLITTTTE